MRMILSRLAYFLKQHPIQIFLSITLLLLSTGDSIAQAIGEYRSVASGNWNNTAIWQRNNTGGGAGWGAVGANGYPGQTAGAGQVTIQSGHAVTVNVSPANPIASLTYQANALTSSVSFNDGFTLTVTGAVTFNDPSVTLMDQTLTVGGGTLTCASITMANTNGGIETGQTNDIVVGAGGTLTVNGNITTNGAAAENTVTLNGTGTLNIAGSFTGGTFNVSNTSTVSWFGDNTNFRNQNYGNLTIEIPATAAANRTRSLTGNLTVQGNLIVQSLHASNIAFFDPAGFTLSVNGTTTLNARGNFVDSNNGGSNTFTGAVTIAANASMSSANTSDFIFVNNITNDGTLSLTNTAQILRLNGLTSQNIYGGGTFSFTNVVLNSAVNDTIFTTSDILINTNFHFALNRLLVVGANANLRIASAASITSTPGFGANCYIQLDGSTSSASQLVKMNSGDDAQWEMTFHIGTAGGGYNPVVITTVANTPDPTNGSTLGVKSIYNASIQGQLRRTFRLVVTGNAEATTFSAATFNYDQTADVSSGDAEGNYTTVWYLNATSSGTWTSIGGTITTGSDTWQPTLVAPQNTLTTGTYYFTLGAPTAYPNTWYSYQTGVWSNWQNWTLDPSGTTLVNGLNLPPQPGDEIVILNGITITNDVPGQVATSTTIQGGATLDMSNTTGNTLGTVSGSGTLRINGVTLPTGTYTTFVSALGGTFEYYNTGGTLPNGPLVSGTPTYNNLKFTNSTGSNITFTQVGNLTVNGTFEITATGAGTVTWQINDNSPVQRTIILYSDLTVGANGRISVGTGNEGAEGANNANQHILNMYGNITNNGIIKFYDASDAELNETYYGISYPIVAPNPDLHRNYLQGNAVTVNFLGTTNKTVTCNNVTDFYRFVVNKGTGQQAILTVNSANTSYFRLFGPSDFEANRTLGNAALYYSDNALSLLNGTLELTGNIDIPHLTIHNTTTRGDFPLPRNAALWLNGAGVTLRLSDLNPTPVGANDGKDGRILMAGLLRVTAGTLNGGFSKGLGSQDGGVYLQEGGTVNVWQFRAKADGTGVFSFTQTGGTLNVGYGFGLSGGTIDQYEEDYFRFDFRSTNSVFQMSGNAILNVAKSTANVGGGDDGGLFRVGSSASNYNVTGGTVNLYMGPKAAGVSYPGYINTTAPLYNLNIYEESATTETAQLQTNPLVVLNNLTINTGNTPSLITNNLNVTVGGNFIINTATTFTLGTGTLTFNGSGAQTWTNEGTITSPLTNVVVNKTTGSTLTIGSATHSTLINAAGTGTITNLTLTSGTLADNGKILTVTGTLSNSATHSGTGAIIANGPTAIGGNNGTFGNLTIQTNGDVSTNGAQSVTGNLRLLSANSSLNIGQNALTVLGNIYSDGGTTETFSVTKRIYTNGLHNAGGLTRRANTDAADVLFPVGYVTTTPALNLYTPATINVDINGGGTLGTITVRPVAGVHPNVTQTGESVAQYWRVTSSGFTGINAVVHKTYTYSTATRNNAGANYRAARYDPVAYTWNYNGSTYNSSAAPGTTIIAHGASPYTFNTAVGWNTASPTHLDGEYTAGNSAAFGAVRTFYAITAVGTPGAWNLNTTWSYTSTTGPQDVPAGAVAGTNFPGPNNPVVIGDGTNNRGVIIDNNSRTCGSLQIASGSVLDCSTFTGLNFGANTAVSGNGTLRIASVGSPTPATDPAPFPGGDFSNFLGPNGGTIEWYGAAKRLPDISTYYNLILNPDPAVSFNLPLASVAVYNDLTKSGDGFVRTDVNAARTITIGRDFTITAGSWIITNTFSTSFFVTGTTVIASGGTLSANNGGTTVHNFSTQGSITNNGTMTLNTASGTRMDITFTGTNDVVLDGSGSTTLAFVNVNKGVSQVPTVNFNSTGAVTAAINGWLVLTNGTFNFNNSGTYYIRTTNASYAIPSTAKLKVSNGTVHIIGDPDTNVNGDLADLLLAGTIEVTGGFANINTFGNDDDLNNDIEYASAGSPTIIISGGELYVNGAIRRPTSTLSGALVYNQSGGTVTVGGRNCDANNTRGVFEIENNLGSSFTMTGGTLNIRRSTSGTAYPDIYINPAVSSVSPSSTITIGMNSNTGVTSPLSMNIVPAIGNFSVINATVAQNVNMRSSSLTTQGSLLIDTNGTLTTNALDVTIGGNLTINGTYVGGTAGNFNTTTFNGTGLQTAVLSGSSTFNNMTVNKPSGNVELSGTSPRITDLNILSGTLDVGSLGLLVEGNITNNSNQISTPGTGSIIMSGTATAHTINSSNGSFNNLTLNNALIAVTTKTITVNGNMTITGALNFGTGAINRYLFIGGNQLTFGTGSSVTNPIGVTNFRFIKTNGVSSDLGVVKNWPANTVGSFTYAVGTRVNYTPVTVTLTTNAGGSGSLTVIPVDEQHPTASATGEEILNYYWIVKRDNTLAYSATGSHAYQFPTSLIGGSGGTRRGAHLDAVNLIGWTQPVGTLNTVAPNTTLTITNTLNTNLPLANGEFHYTVGTVNTLPNPITPVYSRIAGNAATVGNPAVGGNWNLATNWTLASDGTGAGLSTVPVGRPVVIRPGDRINMNIAGLRAFTTVINGTLVATTTGHNLGAISGTGTLRTTTSTLPAGTYTNFVAATGGTIEYAYAGTSTMNSRSTYNNLSIASGTAQMTNTDLILNGDLTIASGATLDNTANNRNITLAGDWTNSGTFTTPAGAGTVTFNGAANQAVTGTTAFNNLTLNKTGNLTLSGTATTTINNLLTLTSGYVIASSTHPLVFGAAATYSGGNASSFIQGPARTPLVAGGTFTYPTGSTLNGRYRPATVFNTSGLDTWTVEYVGREATLDGYTVTTMNTANIGTVSRFEYWNVTRSGASSASLTFNYGIGSYIPNIIGVLANLRVVRWNGTQWDLPPTAAGVYTQSGDQILGSVTVQNVTSFSPFTFGSTDVGSPLPVEWLSFTGARAGNVIALNWTTAQEINNDRFEIERSEDGKTFNKIGSKPSQGNSTLPQEYRHEDKNVNPYQRYYYRLRQVDINGKSDYSAVIAIANQEEYTQRWGIFPNPIESDQHVSLKDYKTDGTKTVEVVLQTSSGQIIFQQKGTLAQLSDKLDKFATDLKSGVYVLQISDGGYREYFRIVRL
ncbi:MAG TPA: T9SS type A sorting domain-containing protein [Ohtaekwangia sp.]